MSDWAQRLLQALAAGEAYPSAQADHPDLDLAGAYDLQRAFVAARDAPIAGFKAALTAQAAQHVMGIGEPIVGALFAGGRFTDAAPIKSERALLLETEFGFRLARDVSAPVEPDTVYGQIEHAAPMIEFASPNLSGKPTGIDLVASNAASYGFLPGRPFAPDDLDPDAIAVALLADGVPVLSGAGSEVLGGQRHALAWLINQVLALGYELRAGHWLMTGSIGGMAPARPGHYIARYEGLGEFAFEIAGA